MLSRLVTRHVIRAFSEAAKASDLEVNSPSGQVSVHGEDAKGDLLDVLRQESGVEEEEHLSAYLQE